VAPDRQARKARITAARKQQIHDAALAVFSEKGFALATTAEIARAAGIAEGTIYNYFSSKRELFVAVIQNFIITAPLLELVDKLPRGDIAGTFTHILQNRFKLIESENISSIPVLMGEIVRDPGLKALWAERFLRPFLARMEEIYRAVMASGKVRRIEPSILVRSIGGMLLGFLMLKMMEGDASPMNRLPRKKVVDAMLDLILHGLLGEDAEAKK
jgi:AcrR family transcriptional regulator